jgi:phospholipase C
VAVVAAIEHVVVLMLENRSFDSMLGKLYPSDGTFDGLTGQESNVYAGQVIPVWQSGALDSDAACIPDPDPGELFTDMNEQLFGDPARPAPPPMSGFAANYMAQPKADKPYQASAVLHYLTPEQVPVISTLAKAFGVSDQWFASAPCQTWPNRFFVHTGTCRGYVNNSKFPIPFPAPSIFRRLSDNGATWRVYFHDVPQSLLLGDIWLEAVLHYRGFSQFLADAHGGALPNYSFIEPRYFADPLLQTMPNDEHPPHNVLFGEQLIASVYNAVRSAPTWKKTLLVITYDEHGGCYDHVLPPPAVPPDACNQDGFDFSRYGLRVPAVLVSPYIPAGSKIRVAPQDQVLAGNATPFDHTSILATLRKLFNLGTEFTARDSIAPDLLSALNLGIPTNDGPDNMSTPKLVVSTPGLVARGGAPPNHMQLGLAQMAASLPVRAPTTFVPPPAPMTPRAPATAASAVTDASMRVRSFLNV